MAFESFAPELDQELIGFPSPLAGTDNEAFYSKDFASFVPQFSDQELIEYPSPLAEPDITLDELDKLFDEQEEEQVKKQANIVDQSASDPASYPTVQLSIDQDVEMQEVEIALLKHNLSASGQQTEEPQAIEAKEVVDPAASSPCSEQHFENSTNDDHQDGLDVVMTEESPPDGKAQEQSSLLSVPSSETITNDLEENTSTISMLDSTKLLQTTKHIDHEALKQGRLTSVTKDDNDKSENLHVVAAREQAQPTTRRSMRISALQQSGMPTLEQQRDGMNANTMKDVTSDEQAANMDASTLENAASANQTQPTSQSTVPQKRKDKTVKEPREVKRLKNGADDSSKAPSTTTSKRTRKSGSPAVKEEDKVMTRRTSSRLNPAVATKSKAYVAPSTRASRRSAK